MGNNFYDKIYNILQSGGKLIIINRKGVELDISLEFAAVASKPKEISKPKDAEEFNKEKIMNELIGLKAEIVKLKEIKNIRDNYIIKKKLYEDSDESKLVKKLKSKNINDINAAIKNYDVDSMEQAIEKEYDSKLTAEIKKQLEDDYNKNKLDLISDYYRKKFK